MHAMAKMAKNCQPLAIGIGCQKWPLEPGDFGENGDFGKNRHRAGDIQNVAKIFKLNAKSGPFKVDN